MDGTETLKDAMIAIAGGFSSLAGKLGWDKARGNGVGPVKESLNEHIKDEGGARAMMMDKLNRIAEDVAFVRGRFKERDEKE
jgi:hypothetical protein